MAKQKIDWGPLFESGEAIGAVQTSDDLGAALRLIFGDHHDVGDSALRNAWRRWAPRYDLGADIRDYLGSQRPGAEYLDELVTHDELRLPGYGRPRAVMQPGHQLRFDPDDGEVCLVTGDIHFGIEDQGAVKIMMEVAEAEGVSRCVLNGDVFDCGSISRHERHYHQRRTSLAEERERGKELVSWVSELPHGGIFIPGNHEDRIWQVVDQNPGLAEQLSPRTVFGLPAEIEVAPRWGSARAGSLVIDHGDRLISARVPKAASVLKAYPLQSTIYGHVNNFDLAMHTAMDSHGRPRSYAAWSTGHLSLASEHVHYMGKAANWQQGFQLVYFYRDDRGSLLYEVRKVEIHDRGAVVGPRFFSR